VPPYLLHLSALSTPLCRALTSGLAQALSQVRGSQLSTLSPPLTRSITSGLAQALSQARGSQLSALPSPLCRALTSGLAQALSQVGGSQTVSPLTTTPLPGSHLWVSPGFVTGKRSHSSALLRI
jgi:hypothetical protein